MEWQFDNSMPIYTQLVDKIKLAIVSGEYAPGQRLPGVRELAAEAGVNPNTMQRAFAELERLELVYTQRNSGRFVTEDTKVVNSTKETLAKESVRSFMSAMQHIGYTKEDIIKLLESSEREDSNGNT